MSADEDTELRDLVAQTLETSGVLGKIRVRKFNFFPLKIEKIFDTITCRKLRPFKSKLVLGLA